MASIVEHSEEIVSVGVFCEARDWQQVAASLITPHFNENDLADFKKNPWKLVYDILVKACFSVVIESLSPSLPEAEKVAFVFEDNRWKDAALAGYDLFKQLHPPSQSCRFGTLAFERKIAFPGLQAADLLAWSYRRAKSVHLEHVKAEIQRSFVTLMRRADRPQFRHLTKAALEDEMKKAIDLTTNGQIS